jgi:hypothetical protein
VVVEPNERMQASKAQQAWRKYGERCLQRGVRLLAYDDTAGGALALVKATEE